MVNPVGPPGNWSLVFEDQFTGTALNTANWSAVQGAYNSSQASAVSVSGGYCHLTLAGMINTNPALQGWGPSVNGPVLEVGGCVEASISFPGPTSTTTYNWPAWWVSGAQWPANGEEDIAEGYDGSLSALNYHSPSGASNGPHPAGNWANSFHTYTLVRGATYLNCYWDGVLVRSTSPSDAGGPQSLIVFHGGGNTLSTTAEILVDYVRMWSPGGSGGQAPVVNTIAATNVTASGVTLNGTVNPEGQAATYQFDYGTTTSYGTSVPSPPGNAGSGAAAITETVSIAGLAPSTTYHYRIEAANATGTSLGADQSFTTTASGGLSLAFGQSLSSVTGGTLTTSSFTPQTNDIIVVKAVTENSNASTIITHTPTGGGWTYTQRVKDETASTTSCYIWTAPVTTGGTAQTVSLIGPSFATGHWLMTVELWRGGQLAATPATCDTRGTGAPTATLTTVAANSVVSWGSGDFNGITGTTVYRSGANEEGNQQASAYACAYTAWQQAGAAGAQTLGQTAPGGQQYTITGIEIQPAIAPGVTLVGSIGAGTAATSGTTVTGTYGQSPTAGNLLVAAVEIGGNNAIAFAVTGPAGWTQLVPDRGDGVGGSGASWSGLSMWYKVAAGGDAAPVFTYGTSIYWARVYTLELAGANTTTPLDTSGYLVEGSYTAANTQTVTTGGNVTGSGEYAICVTSASYVTGGHTPITGFTSQAADDQAPFHFALDTQSGPSAGAAAGGSDTWTGGEAWVIQLAVIAAASGSTSATGTGGTSTGITISSSVAGISVQPQSGPTTTPVLPQIVVEAGLLPDSPVQGSTTLLLGDPVHGKLDTATLGTAIIWTDISSYVIGFTVGRPATRQQGPLWNYQAGTTSITLDNSSGIFDVANSASPYAGLLNAMVPVRVRAVFGTASYSLFSGFADGWLPAQVTYEGGYAELTLNGTDAFKVLAGITLAGVATPVGAGADTGARISDILRRAGWYTMPDRNVISTGNSTLQGTTLGDTALNLMQIAADSEIGQLYVSGTGAVTFRARRDLLGDTRSKTVQAVFGDLPGTVQAAGTELAYAAVARVSDDTTIANDIQATRVGGSLQEVQDAASIAKYLFPRSYARSDLILQNDIDAYSWAGWVLYISKGGEDRFESLAVDPAADPYNLWPQVLGREIGDRIQVWTRPAGVASPVSKDCFIAGIAHSWDSVTSAWLTTWTLQSADKYGSFLTLDNPTLGKLDANALTF